MIEERDTHLRAPGCIMSEEFTSMAGQPEAPNANKSIAENTAPVCTYGLSGFELIPVLLL